jgi:hypothetical protein
VRKASDWALKMWIVLPSTTFVPTFVEVGTHRFLSCTSKVVSIPAPWAGISGIFLSSCWSSTFGHVWA